MTSRSRRWPVLPTLLVGFAIVAMVALGLWQLLDRLPRKEAFLAQVAANPQRPPITFPAQSDDRLIFRRSQGLCAPPVTIQLFGAGALGFRALARCGPASSTPNLTVQLGITRDPMAKPRWNGGTVAGLIAHQPDQRSLLGTLSDGRPVPLMIVADPPVAGLSPNPRPSIAAIPNNHLAYAGQWFFFACVAAVIYVLALRHRQR